MKYVKHMARVDAEKCNGDKLCETICPTGAIHVVKKKAVVDEDLCRACFKCRDICRQEAITITARAHPITVVTPEDVDEERINALCAKANLFPDQPVCACTLTQTREVAAAILKGAKTPEELSIMTGVRTGCGIYCMGAIQRLLKASGIDLKPPANKRWYSLPLSVWDVPDEVDERHPGYYIGEDKKLYKPK